MVGWIVRCVAVLLLAGPALAESIPANATHARIVGADSEPQNWLSHGRTYTEQRHSPLDQVNVETVSDLGLAWSFDARTKRGLEATPIVVDGVMYLTGTWSVVYALDAATGEMIWQHDPRVPRNVARAACCDVVNRGVAVWKGKVFVGTLDGRLVALDARDGSVVWETMTVDASQPYTITGAPRVVKGLVLIGNGGAEYGVRGYLGAYDAETGELAWRFYTVPGNPHDGFENATMEMAAATWTGEWWKLGGGGTVWDSMSYDPELDLLYVGVGNGSPWNRRLRSPDGGDNLFLCSIVALRPETGEYVWHYQVVPAETWDYTATQHMILADIEWQGQPRKVLMQAPKSGFFMLLDRETGELLSAEPYADVTWASHYDLETGRPVENPGQDYADGSATVRPASSGAHNWQPMAFDPSRELVFIPVTDAVFTYKGVDELKYEPGLRHLGVDRSESPPGDALFMSVIQKRLTSGRLVAWDPKAQSEVWRADYSLGWNGGVLSTAGGLVFQGSGDQMFYAYAADTGDRLWSFETQAGVMAAPVAYSVAGQQYVTVLAGWGGAYGLMSGIKPPPGSNRSRVLTFKLGAKAELPPVPAPAGIPDPPPRLEVGDDVVERGSELYSSYCSFCHGAGAISGGTIADLRHLHPDKHAVFDAIVRFGAFEGLGMPRFGDVLEEEDVVAVQAFLIEKAHEDKALREAPEWWIAVKRAAYEVVSWFFTWFMEPSSHSA